MNDTKSVRKSSFAIVTWLTPAFAVLMAASSLYVAYDVYREHSMQKELEAERTRKEHAVAEIEKLEAIVRKEGRPPDDRVTRVYFVPIGELVDGKTVIKKSAITDADLRHLTVLTELEEVRLTADGFTNAGLEHLKGLTTLKSLSISNPNITDDGLCFLRGLKNLDMLNLTGTSITEEGVQELQKALPDCTITFKSIGR